MSTQTQTLFKFSAATEQETLYRTRVSTRNFSFIVDKEKEVGGTDQAPNPVEYLLGAYAACLHIVAHLVAKEEGIDLGKLSIDISGELDGARFLTGSKKERAGYQSLQVNLTTTAPISDADKRRVLEIVEDRCPINDTIRNATPVSARFN